MPRKSSLKVVEPPVSEIVWRDGSRPPYGIAAADVKAALDQLSEPSPERLLEASKDKKHCLHAELWAEGDQIWAQRGRLERCRHIVGDLVEIRVVGGRTIETRAVEFLRVKDETRWASIDDIMADKELVAAYLAEVQRLQDQASAKLSRVRGLMEP